MAKEWKTVLEAAAAAAKWHAHQRDKSGAPYVNHLIEVAMLTAESTRWRHPELVVAALLHDASEHQGVPPERITKQFGRSVGRLVSEVTDDPSLPEKGAKRRQIEDAGRKSPRAKILKLADKISNLRAIAESPRRWRRKRRLEYVRWARAVANGLRGVSVKLEREFHRAAKKAEDP
jgi:(p)ppGpp synthase/HD superfamily hydrolase